VFGGLNIPENLPAQRQGQGIEHCQGPGLGGQRRSQILGQDGRARRLIEGFALVGGLGDLRGSLVGSFRPAALHVGEAAFEIAKLGRELTFGLEIDLAFAGGEAEALTFEGCLLLSDFLEALMQIGNERGELDFLRAE